MASSVQLDIASVRSSKPLATVASVFPDVEGIWIVGGAVRDLLEGRAINDVDLVTVDEPTKLAKRLARDQGLDIFRLSDQFGCWRVIDSDRGWQADFCRLKGSTIEADLRGRDFTVNAIAVPLAGGELVDPTGGLTDLKKKLLRPTSNSAFADDPLRVLRLSRFVAERDYCVPAQYMELATQQADLLASVPSERVFEEFRKLLVSGNPLTGIESMADTGAIATLLPELWRLRGLEQTPYHHLDAYGHTLEVVERAIEIERQPERFGVSDFAAGLLREEVADSLSGWQALRLAALLHDLGKSETRGEREDGRVSFIGHDKVGARMTDEICSRLHTSRRLRAFLKSLTLNHLHLGFLVNKAEVSRADIYQYIKKCEPYSVATTVLTVADRFATRGGRTKQSAIDDHLELAAKMLTEIEAFVQRGPAPVNGEELMEALGLEPGPELGRLLSAIEEADFIGTVKTKDEAIALAKVSIDHLASESPQ